MRWVSPLLPKLRFVRFPLGAPVYESGERLSHVYFPTRGIVSLLYVTNNGDSAELAVIGSEGMVGVSLFMGGETTPNRAIVQAACDAYELPARDLKEKFAEDGTFQLLMLKFTQALITQVSQTAVCNLHHTIDQQEQCNDSGQGIGGESPRSAGSVGYGMHGSSL